MRHVLPLRLLALVLFSISASFSFGFHPAPFFRKPACCVKSRRPTTPPIFIRPTFRIHLSLTEDEAELDYDDDDGEKGVLHDGLFPLYHAFLVAVESNRWEEASQRAHALKQSGYLKLDRYTARILLVSTITFSVENYFSAQKFKKTISSIFSNKKYNFRVRCFKLTGYSTKLLAFIKNILL